MFFSILFFPDLILLMQLSSSDKTKLLSAGSVLDSNFQQISKQIFQQIFNRAFCEKFLEFYETFLQFYKRFFFCLVKHFYYFTKHYQCFAKGISECYQKKSCFSKYFQYFTKHFQFSRKRFQYFMKYFLYMSATVESRLIMKTRSKKEKVGTYSFLNFQNTCFSIIPLNYIDEDEKCKTSYSKNNQTHPFFSISLLSCSFLLGVSD